MTVNVIDKATFLDKVYNQTEAFLNALDEPQAFVVKAFYPKDEILEWREMAFQSSLTSEPSWHPCLDGCPDYHRIHDNYPKAHVKAIMHAYYYHGYYTENKALFTYFSEIFDLKNYLAGTPKGSFQSNIPSDMIISRVNLHNYPVGGGYQAQHIDPVSKFAKIQTIVQASEYGKDFHSGGVFGRLTKDGEKFYLDPHTEIGDLIIMSPSIIHGVEEIDPEADLDWRSDKGRWMIMPIIIHSDYPSDDNIKPKEVE